MKLLDWRSGGGLLLVAVAIALAYAAWHPLRLDKQGATTVGDGRTVESYGFDLSTALVPADDIVASGLGKDKLRALDDPAVMPVVGVAEFNAAHNGKYLVSDDRVVGVAIGDQARAYPLRVLNWHEVVNDTLAGVPIAVTYHPLCDSVVVFDRRVGEQTLRFGVSGLLLDSNILMFDRQDEGDESLWSQLGARAIAGPAAAEARNLDVLPASIAGWQDWAEAHPQTTVLDPDEELYNRYRGNPYGSYYLAGKPRFPVDPLPPDDGLPWMTRVLVIQNETRERVLSLRRADLDNLPQAAQSLGAEVRVAHSENARGMGDGTPSLLIEAQEGTRTYHSLWFAWYAAHPGSARAALRAAVKHP